MNDLYKPAQIAAECGVSQWLVTRHLRRVYSSHAFKSWWRLEPAEYEEVCATLRSAKLACPKQPRHALEQPQKFLIFG